MPGSMRRASLQAAFALLAGWPITGNALAGGITLLTSGAPAVEVAAEQIAALPHRSETMIRKTATGEERTDWSGPLLWDVLVAGKAIDPARHADHVRITARIAGRDGYTARIVIAEISPDFADKPIVLADRMNGAALPDHALRLIVPNEKRGGRSVRDPVSITIEHEKDVP